MASFFRYPLYAMWHLLSQMFLHPLLEFFLWDYQPASDPQCRKSLFMEQFIGAGWRYSQNPGYHLCIQEYGQIIIIFILFFGHRVPPFFEFWLAPEIPSSQSLRCIFLMSTADQQPAGFSLIMALQFLFRVFPGQAATPVCLSSTLCSEPGHPAAYELELSSRSRIPREQMGHTLSASTGITLPPAGCRQTGVLSFDPLVTPTHCCILFAGRYKFNRYPHRRSPGALTWLERVV